MANTFYVSNNELRFLMMFSEISTLHGFEDLLILEDRKEVCYCRDMLCKKQYLLINEQKEYILNESLKFLLMVVKKPYTYFVVESLCQSNMITKQVIYFVNDSIVLVSQQEEMFEFVWIPFIPLAIGGIANLLSPFLNMHTIEIGRYPIGEKDSLIEFYKQQGFSLKWKLYSKENETNTIFILSNDYEQIMFQIQNEQMIVNKPDKVDYVNVITRLLISAHGKAIKGGTNE